MWLYHFIDWQYSGKDQADHFFSVISNLSNPGVYYPGTYFAVDVEEPNGKSSIGSPSLIVVHDFLYELGLQIWGDRNDNTYFVMYTNKDTWTQLGNPSTYSNMPLWWTVFKGQTYQPTPDDMFGGWTDWTLMQYAIVNLQGSQTDVSEIH